jgi:hypothetical protein
LVLFLVLSAALAWPQTVLPDGPSTAAQPSQQAAGSAGAQTSQSEAGAQSNPQTAAPAAPAAPAPKPEPAPAEQKKDDSSGKQTKRIVGVVPNFNAVSADTELPPLTTKQKFVIASKDSFDYSSFIWAGVLAGQGLAFNSTPELGHGARGYGRYYWRAFADQASGAYFTEAIVPWVTHEDPRYYTMGHGGFFRRTYYAVSQLWLTKTDAEGDHEVFNYSEVVGNGLEAGLSNAYYPPQERGLAKTAESFGTQMESACINNVVKEFWPDIRKKVLRRK